MTGSQEIAAVVTLSKTVLPFTARPHPLSFRLLSWQESVSHDLPTFFPARVQGPSDQSWLSSISHTSLSRTMATLYRDPDWSSKSLERAILEARRHVVKDKMPALFPDQLLKFQEELQQRRQEGYKVTFTDFWGLLIEACLGDEVGAQLPLGPNLPGADAQPSAFMRASGGTSQR